MKETQFKDFLESLESITSKNKAVGSRISRAKRIEKVLKLDLDTIVKDDYKTYQTLLEIQAEFGDKNGAIQNVLRKYYIFTHGKEFPSIAECKKKYQ
ncbi:hypothetical protein [Paenibacillus odorifer]|uniref:hypothetical protein n=1 Tax=Paenibacillus odorifer TaxID=189426 RepID=UPI00096C62AB|nr:hypothetical protein [Paenibacillus odorifer]OMD66091.1 hypothetical protein BSK50_30825 [Paenibacillus odorifer]